jgi:hypothetical protein
LEDSHVGGRADRRAKGAALLWAWENAPPMSPTNTRMTISAVTRLQGEAPLRTTIAAKEPTPRTSNARTHQGATSRMTFG